VHDGKSLDQTFMKMACVHSISLPATGQSIGSIGPIPSELNSRPNNIKKIQIYKALSYFDTPKHRTISMVISEMHNNEVQ